MIEDIKDEKSLYIYAMENEFAVSKAKEIVNHPSCSLAIALYMFYKSQEVEVEPYSEAEKEIIQFSQNLYMDIKQWKYVPKEMGFKVPLTPSQKFKLDLELDQEDKIFIRDVPGVMPDALS